MIVARKAGKKTNRSAPRGLVRRLASRLVRGALLLLSVGLFLYFAHLMVMNYQEIADLNSQLDHLTHELEEEKSIHEELEQRIEMLGEDGYIEVLARKHLRMIRPGDIPINWPTAGIR